MRWIDIWGQMAERLGIVGLLIRRLLVLSHPRTVASPLEGDPHPRALSTNLFFYRTGHTCGDHHFLLKHWVSFSLHSVMELREYTAIVLESLRKNCLWALTPFWVMLIGSQVFSPFWIILSRVDYFLFSHGIYFCGLKTSVNKLFCCHWPAICVCAWTPRPDRFDSWKCKMTLFPWARHFTLLALAGMSLYLLLIALDKSVC